MTAEMIWGLIFHIQVLYIHFKFIFEGECVWLHLDLIKSMKNFCQKLYPVVEYCYTTIPTYPSGQIGFLICSTNPVSLFPFTY